MNSRNKHILWLMALTVSAICLFLVLQSSQNKRLSPLSPVLRQKQKVSPILYPDSIYFAGERVPLSDPEVLERVDREFMVNTFWQSNMMLWLKRSPRVFERMLPILHAHGIPEDFKYLAVIESGLTHVVSPAGAAGYWQLLPSTARELGLEVNAEVDERYHLEKSTKAACQYLKQARESFGSWTLAAAAYNMGLAGLQRQLTQQEVESYYDLRLNAETSRYVPRIIAAKYILSNPVHFGFDFNEEDAYEWEELVEWSVDSSIQSLSSWSKQHQSSYKTLRYYNPWLRGDALKNSGEKTYRLLLPKK